MLYLEDFLEILEQLPSELRDRSTEMRMLDLQVQSGVDLNDKSIREFMKLAPNFSQDRRDQWYMKIKEDFQKIHDQAEEKVSIADTMYTLVEKYYNKLSKEILKFKVELDDDNPGITEHIERKLQESEKAIIAHRRERKRRAKQLEALQMAESINHQSTTSLISPIQPINYDPTLQPPSLKLPNMKKAQTFPKHLGDLKILPNSYDLATKYDIFEQKSEHFPDQSTGIPSFLGPESRHGRPRNRAQQMLKDTLIQRQEKAMKSTRFSTGSSTDNEEEDGEEDEHDDSRRAWCICNKKSYGDMVACDNKDCPFEWFHYSCVNISAPPKGKWYCPHCTETKIRKNQPFD